MSLPEKHVDTSSQKGAETLWLLRSPRRWRLLSSSFVARTPGHRFQLTSRERSQVLPSSSRLKGPRLHGATKAPAIRDKAIYRAPDTGMMVPAGTNAIVPVKPRCHLASGIFKP